MTDTRKKWLLAGIKRTRRHEIRLLAHTADEAINLAKGSYRFTAITSCVEEPPIKHGRVTYLGWAAANDERYLDAGWTFIFGKNLNPRFR
jgi:hypothetical protein